MHKIASLGCLVHSKLFGNSEQFLFLMMLKLIA